MERICLCDMPRIENCKSVCLVQNGDSKRQPHRVILYVKLEITRYKARTTKVTEIWYNSKYHSWVAIDGWELENNILLCVYCDITGVTVRLWDLDPAGCRRQKTLAFRWTVTSGHWGQAFWIDLRTFELVLQEMGMKLHVLTTVKNWKTYFDQCPHYRSSESMHSHSAWWISWWDCVSGLESQ